jgi:hypothetical protein
LAVRLFTLRFNKLLYELYDHATSKSLDELGENPDPEKLEALESSVRAIQHLLASVTYLLAIESSVPKFGILNVVLTEVAEKDNWRCSDYVYHVQNDLQFNRDINELREEIRERLKDIDIANALIKNMESVSPAQNAYDEYIIGVINGKQLTPPK